MEIDDLQKFPFEMADALRAIAINLTEDVVKSLSLSLYRETGFLTNERLREAISNSIKEQDLAAAVFLVLSYIEPIHLRRVLNDFAKLCRRNSEFVPDSAIESLQKLLPRLVQEYPAMSRRRIAQRVADLSGTTVSDVKVVLDLRPVLGSGDAGKIQGLIPLTTIQLLCEGSQREAKVIEAVLTEAAVNRLSETIADVRKQLQQMKAVVEEEMNQTWVVLD
jgi:hypothetical protein